MTVLAGLIPAAACAGLPDAPPNVPGWFEEKAAKADAKGYPDLNNLPEPRIVPAGDEARAQALIADLKAARAALESDPRATPAPPATDVADFEQKARAEIDRGR
jgi:hypothetical protein